MEKLESNQDILDLCSPITGGSGNISQSHKLTNLSGRGLGYTGNKSHTLACLVVKETDQQGGFQREVLYPAAASVQEDSRLSRHVRAIEFHTTISAAGETGLLYHKPPLPGLPPNTWLASAKQAVNASIECWGHFNSDHIAGAYRFIEADDQLPDPEKLPSPKKLIQDILGGRVITSMEHPVIQQLLGTSSSPSTTNTDGWEDESAY